MWQKGLGSVVVAVGTDGHHPRYQRHTDERYDSAPKLSHRTRNEIRSTTTVKSLLQLVVFQISELIDSSAFHQNRTQAMTKTEQTTPAKKTEEVIYNKVLNKHEYEFGGPIGVLALMIWSHYILFYFW